MPALIVDKKVKNGILYKGEPGKQVTMRVDNVRFSYPHIGKPWAKNPEKETAAYSVVGMLPKDTHADVIKLIRQQIKEICEANDVRLKPSLLALKDGDSENNDKAEYEGHWYLSTRETKNPPTAKKAENGKLRNLTNDEAEKVFYGGCYGSILFRLWFQDNDWGKRVNGGLLGVVFTADGESFGEGRIDDSDAYDDLGEDEGGFDDLEDDDL